MSTEQKKVFAKGAFLKEVKFDNWSKINMSGKADEFCEFIQSIKNDKGFYNLEITEKKEEWKKEYSTHDLAVSTFKPKEQMQTAGNQEDDSSDLPF